ncbi:hypothetical protein IE077_003058 [Cardiosporidium cionae]|uniref:Uncharacterized protein n=1 Tax=Cardiosporidium cionae TaxID=476202 RepID=A0ABQ7J970_9APIC|nr:hypothetical protein IE077_003058 [Cardiosporidium cionae]|eukprot:KAF8820543.1 hypothetical protein IE077_003058 [Cardiosporidium cionae]
MMQDKRTDKTFFQKPVRKSKGWIEIDRYNPIKNKTRKDLLAMEASSGSELPRRVPIAPSYAPRPSSSTVEFPCHPSNLKDAQKETDVALLHFQITQLQESYRSFQAVTESIKSFFKTRVADLENRYMAAVDEKKNAEAQTYFLEDKCQFLEEQLKLIVQNLRAEVQLHRDELRVRKWEYFHKELTPEKIGSASSLSLDGTKSDEAAATLPASVEPLKQILSVREKQQERLAAQLHSLNNSYIKLMDTQKQHHQREESLRKEISVLTGELSREKRLKEELQIQLVRRNQYRPSVSTSTAPFSIPTPRNSTTSSNSLTNNSPGNPWSPRTLDSNTPFEIPTNAFMTSLQTEITTLFARYCDEKEQNQNSETDLSLPKQKTNQNQVS